MSVTIDTVVFKTLEGEEFEVPVVSRNQMSIDVEMAGRVFRYSADAAGVELVHEARFLREVTS